MGFWAVLYQAAKRSKVRTTDIGPKLGLSRGFVSACKTQNVEPKIYNAARLLSVCGFTLCAIPSEKVPDDALVIDFERE